MLSLEEGKKAVKLARNSIESEFREINQEIELSPSFENKRGVFVTIEKEGELRGCIGRPYPNQILKKGIIEASKDSALNDPRFPPLEEKEIDEITIEVTVLTKPKKIGGDSRDRAQKIEIGKHGLIASSDSRRGLLLPQVPVDNNWDEVEFLSQTAIKAGLQPDSWLDEEVDYFKFEGQVFSEKTPNGLIEEREIDEGS
ncbi:TIGR00296 family protein [archaeon SCG-AAA382B04]|nr:TIGR00296 family protein [archaeon SCG-AAA382B04]